MSRRSAHRAGGGRPPADDAAPAGRHRRGAHRAAARPRRARPYRAGRVVLVVLLAAAVAAGATVAVGVLGRHGQRPAAQAHHQVTAVARTQRTVLLVVRGPDGRAVESALLAHDSAASDGVAVLVPSPMMADVPGHGSLPFGDSAALADAGLPGDTLADLMGVNVDATWTLSVSGLAALVDRLGGVTVASVDVDVVAQTAQGAEQVVVPKGGQQHLSGAQAVAYATYLADGEEEQARLARFTAVLSGILAALPAQPSAVTADLAALGSLTGATEPLGAVGSLLTGLAGDARADNLTVESLPVQRAGTGDQLYTAQSAQVADLVHRYLGGSVPAQLGQGHNRVIIANGTGALGLGESARRRLEAGGLVFVRSENQDGFTFQHRPSVVLVPDATAASRALGHRVAAALGLPDTDIEVYGVPTSAADVVAILGDDYRP